MTYTPTAHSVRRIPRGPHNATAKIAMLVGSVVQSIALVVGIVTIIQMRGTTPAPIDGAVVVGSAVLYLAAAFLTSYGYTHFNTTRAILHLPILAVFGIVVVALIVVTGGLASPIVVTTQTEGETDKKPNFAISLLTMEDAALVLDGMVKPPELHGFGDRVSSCEFERVKGYATLRLTVTQAPAVPTLFARQNKRGTPIAGLGDEAAMSKHGLDVRIADTELRMFVYGVKLDEPRQEILVDLARRMLERLQAPAAPVAAEVSPP